jgi:Domain of unknown function (DUF4386)
MTRMTNARVAGVAYLCYIAVGISNEILMNRATSAEGIVATLARIAEHATDVRIVILLKLVESFSAIVLAVALYGITRDEDHDLAMLGLACRVAEGVTISSIFVPADVRLLWLAQAPAGVGDVATATALGASLLMPSGSVGSIFFAVGTTVFSYLLLRGRMIPTSLAWLGVFSSALLAVGLSLQLAGLLTGSMTGYQWLPEIVFTVVLTLWLLVKGVAPRATADDSITRQPTRTYPRD